MGADQLVHTVCLHTRDATSTSEGRFTLQVPGNPAVNSAVKVALGSLEFPVVQYTVEEDWSRVYFSEGYRLNERTARMVFEEGTERGTQRTEVVLPMHLNPVTKYSRLDSERMLVECWHPHGLFAQDGSCLVPTIEWGDVEILCGPLGVLLLTRLALRFESSTSFSVPWKGVIPDGEMRHCGYLHVPTIPCPTALCKLLTRAVAGSGALAVSQVEYDPARNRTAVVAPRYPPGTRDFYFIRLMRSPLTTLLGYPSEQHYRRFAMKQPAAFIAGAEATDHLPPLRLPSEQFYGWGSVAVPPGWYAPQHRPMTTGNPLRLTQQLELALNRMYFPLPERVPSGALTGHFIIFVDPCGHMHDCAIPCGKYSPTSFARHVERTMTIQCRETAPGCSFLVEYDAASEKFTFACNMTDAETVAGSGHAAFALLFNHPMSIDAARIGFDDLPLYGSHQYTSTTTVAIPRLNVPSEAEEPRWHQNVYRVTEIPHQKRIRVHAVPVPTLTGVVESYDHDTSHLTVRTYASGLPFSHGFQVGSVVLVSPSGPAAVCEPGESGERQVRPCPLAPLWRRAGVVVQTSDDDATLVILAVRNQSRMGECVGGALHLHSSAQPFSLCLGTLPKSMSPPMLGFPAGAHESGGKAGTVPCEAPYVHSLDHPDYVLLYLIEGNKAAAISHQHGANTTSPFAKIVLYPMFREERMLPRDTTLLSGSSLNRFTLQFRNPDGTPYHFHGAQFSISLNFVAVA